MSTNVSLRRATMEDATIIFNWRNDPRIVSLGISQKQVSWRDHEAWLCKVLGDTDRHLLYIIERKRRRLGVVRLDRDKETAVTTVYLDPKNTGQGVGVEALRQVCEVAFRLWPIHFIGAQIRRENSRSIRAFEKAGFCISESGLERTVLYRLARTGFYLSKLKAFYQPKLEKYGTNALAAGWGSHESQVIRLRILLAVADLNNASILDVGCGLGHLVDELIERNYKGVYRGIDILERMVYAARRRHPEWNFTAEDVRAAKPRSADYVLSSGLFTFADESIFKETVATMFKACRRAVAFNSLSSKAGKKENNELYIDPLNAIEYCKSICENVVARHDYLAHDFTIYMYRQEEIQ